MSVRSPTYPIFLKLETTRCLVVGGGQVGERKVKGLMEAGATVVVVSPEVTDALEGMVGERLTVHRRPFRETDMDDVGLAVAATDVDSVNRAVVSAARDRGVWVNDAASRERSTFILPASVRQGGLTLAVSTDGGSPAYAKLVREMLECEFGEEHGLMVALLTDLRPRVKEAFGDATDRRAFWDRLVTVETLDMIKNGQIDIVKERANQWLSS